MPKKKNCSRCGAALDADGICTALEDHEVEEEVDLEADTQDRIATVEEHAARKVLNAEKARIESSAKLRATKRELDATLGELQQAYLALSLFDQRNLVVPEWMAEAEEDQPEHHGTLVAMLSDTHYGEVVSQYELGGYNAYNMDIAETRTRLFFENAIMVARDYMAGVEYDGFVLALNGDLVSGDIHDELVETNELSTYETVIAVLPWLKRGIEMLAEEFGKVHVVSAPGNHGRNSSKPRHKRRSANNADTLIARLLAGQFTDDEQEISFDIPESVDVDFSVYGYVFTMDHGDNYGTFNGGSEIGALGPVKRGTGRKSRKRQEMGRPFHYNLVSHFHQYVPAYTQGFIMNGSVKGFDEYANDLQLKPEQAQQALWVVSPEYGITGAHQIIVQKRNEEW